MRQTRKGTILHFLHKYAVAWLVERLEGGHWRNPIAQCSSMVLISPPEGRVPGEEPPATPAVLNCHPATRRKKLLPRKDSAGDLVIEGHGYTAVSKGLREKAGYAEAWGFDVGLATAEPASPQVKSRQCNRPPVQLPTGGGAKAEVVTSRTTRLPVAASIAVAIASPSACIPARLLQPRREIAAAGLLLSTAQRCCGETFLTGAADAIAMGSRSAGRIGLACVLVVWALISGRRHATDAAFPTTVLPMSYAFFRRRT